MKAYEVECSGTVHRVALDDDGNLVLLDHDLEAEVIASLLGAEAPMCLEVLSEFENSAVDLFVSAAQKGLVGLVQLGLDLGIPVSTKNALALRKAAEYGHADVVLLLLSVWPHHVHANKDEALRLAATSGHADVVKILIKYHADIGAKRNEALIMAAFGGYGDVVRLLLDAGANLNIPSPTAVLSTAAANCHPEVVKQLLEAGAVGLDKALEHARAYRCQKVIDILEYWIEGHPEEVLET